LGFLTINGNHNHHRAPLRQENGYGPHSSRTGRAFAIRIKIHSKHFHLRQDIFVPISNHLLKIPCYLSLKGHDYCGHLVVVEDSHHKAVLKSFAEPGRRNPGFEDKSRLFIFICYPCTGQAGGFYFLPNQSIRIGYSAAQTFFCFHLAKKEESTGTSKTLCFAYCLYEARAMSSVIVCACTERSKCFACESRATYCECTTQTIYCECTTRAT
jgi:hypothetical protein